MKRYLSALLVLCLLLLCGCGSNGQSETTVPSTTAVTEEPTASPTEEPTEAPTEEPTEPPTEAPTEAPTEPPIPTNPLTGEVLDAPLDSRVFGVTINNVPGAMPMYGVSKADLFFEMFINSYATRGLALYADISEVKAVGSVRSLRHNFIDICQAYDAVVVHAGGDDQVLSKLPGSGVPNISVESEAADYYFRDQDRLSAGYAWEHTLFVKGEATKAYAEKKGIRVTGEEGRNYGLTFAEDGTPVGGEDATKITINLIHDGVTKKTGMTFDASVGMYKFSQYNKTVRDASENCDIYFENVIVILCPVVNQNVYHVAQLEGSGEGYFACNGKLVPIKWTHEKETDPFTFTYADGTPLDLGVGNSYVAIAPLTSTVVYE